MSRHKDWSQEAMDARQKALAQVMTEGPRKGVIGPYVAWLEHPDLCEVGEALGRMLRFGGVLPGDLRELAILTNAAHWKAAFEFQEHARVARLEGLPEGIIAALEGGTEPPFTREEERLVHRIACGLCESGQLSDADYAAAEAAFGRKGLIELVAIVGYYCMVAFTLNSFAILPK